jgi:hypothetical protein
MSDLEAILADLRRQEEGLMRRIEQVRGAIRAMEEAQTALHEAGLSSAATENVAEPPALPQRVRGALSPEQIARAARDTLLELGRPMKRGALARAMEARQIPLAGKDKSKNLGTILWRHPAMFVTLDKLGYWPKDVPLDGIYDPDA